MATYEIHAEPPGNVVWLLLAADGPQRVTRAPSGRWNLHGGLYDWPALLGLGTVTDVDPDDVSWLPPGPWLAEEEVVVDAGGQQVLYVAADGLATQRSERKLAALIARLVNEHVARQAGAS